MGERCYHNAHEAVFFSQSSLDSVTLKMEKDTNLINFGVEPNTYEGHFQFEYLDTSNFIQTVLNNDFYMDILIEEDEKNFNENDDIKSSDYNKYLSILIMQYIIDNKLKLDHYQVKNISQLQSENPTYLISIKSNVKQPIPNKSILGSMKNIMEKSTYKIWSISKNNTK